MTLVVAHRGASAAHPPGNTVAALVAAVDLGADWVEIDVHLTADGVPVVHHDPDLADGRSIGASTRADLPAWVPDLATALDACGPLGVNVEIKPDGPDHLRDRLVESVVDELVARGPERFLVTSFAHSIADHVRALAPELPTGLLTIDAAGIDDVIERAASDGHVAIAPWFVLVDDAAVERAHSRGLLVNVWTIDDPTVIRSTARAGVDAIITNVPDVCRRVLSED